jgi:hypothetical protein
MSNLRPECGTSQMNSPNLISRDAALFLLRDAIAKRSNLIYGQLHGARGKHCAMGCLWADNPRVVTPGGFVDEVAAVNDSVPVWATQKQRWKVVNAWVNKKIRELAKRA